MEDGIPFSVYERISSAIPPPLEGVGFGLTGWDGLGLTGTSTGRGVSAGTGSDTQET